MAHNSKLTKTGGKKYSEPGLPDGTVAGINKPEMLSDEYFTGGSGSPEQQEDKPFGTTTAGG